MRVLVVGIAGAITAPLGAALYRARASGEDVDINILVREGGASTDTLLQKFWQANHRRTNHDVTLKQIAADPHLSKLTTTGMEEVKRVAVGPWHLGCRRI